MTSPPLSAFRVVRSTAADDLASALRQMITSGALKPGEVLRQERLAAELGASRTPLREALQRLATENLVRLDRRRGAVVTLVTQQDLVELYKLRELIECGTIEEVVRLFTESDYKRLITIAAHGATVSEEQEWVASNRAFHTAVYEISRLPQHIEIIESLGRRADVYVSLLAGTGTGRTRADDDHFQLVEALRNGDAPLASEIVRKHLRGTVEATFAMCLTNAEGDQKPMTTAE